MDMPLVERIARLDAFTPADQKLARYVEDAFPNIAFQNLETIAKATGVSVASVTRFVRKLGYEDFRDFSASVRQEVSSNYDRPLQRGIEPDPSEPGGELARRMNRAMTEIEHTLEGIGPEQFSLVADLLADADRPLFLGSTATGRALIEYFYLLSKYLRRNIRLLPGPDMLAHELIDLTPTSVLFVTAFDRHPRPMEVALRHAREVGATTVLLTNRAASPLRRYADHVLLAYSDPTPLFKSRATMVLVMESLLVAMERRAPSRTVQRTENLESLVEAIGVQIFPQR